jgi:hypothetical protein
LDARKSSQEGIDLSTFYCTKESLVKFFLFSQKNNLHHHFQPSSLMDQLSNPLDIASTNIHITQIYDKNSSNIVGKCGCIGP